MNKKCQVFTPENYVRELLDSVGYTHNLYGKKILENSCGDGNILVAVVQRYIDDCKENGLSRTRIKNGLAKDIYGIEIDEEQYKKCIDNLDEVLKRNDIDKVDWKVINADYLKWNTTIKFQYIVGNPPYITYSELKEEEQLFVKSNFSTCVKGKFDYCYAFIEKGINSLADNGKMSYLIPSSIYKTVFGHNLRIFMSPYIAQIKDYKQVKIFDKALVKSSIMILDKQRQQEFLHYQDMSMENAIDIPIAQLDEKWFFADENEVGQHRFGDYFKVSHVVATLLNKAYVLQDGTYIEGIIENESFKLLKDALIRIISILEKDRAYIARSFKIYDDRVNHKEKTKQEGSQIAKSVLSGKKDKNYKAQKEKMESLAKTVQYFEEEREELITELKLLRALATNGLITTSIVHDLKSINALLVNRVEPMRMAIENNNKMLIERNLNDLYKNDQFLKSWITVVTNQSKKDKRKRLKKNIYDTIEKIVNVLQPILVQKKVQVELIKDEQNAERRIFESDFESIFYNLIINSIEAFSKSSTKNRKIRIELKTNENLVVNYLDNGDGLDNKFKNPYEIFTLGSTSKYDQFGNVIGTGLGMYIIASTVREYNGDYKLTQIQNGFGLEIRIPL